MKKIGIHPPAEIEDFFFNQTSEGISGWLTRNTGYGMYEILLGVPEVGRQSKDNIHPEHLKLKYEIYITSDWNMPYIKMWDREDTY